MIRKPWSFGIAVCLMAAASGPALAQSTTEPPPRAQESPQDLQTPRQSPAGIPQPGGDVPSTAVHPPEKKVALEFTSLSLMRKKGIISQAEFESALKDMGDSLGARAGESLSLMLSKWSLTFYGFVEADMIWDSTQSLNEVPGNSQIARPDTYGGKNSRFMVGIRNSRFGFRARAPEYHKIRASANLEFDALGNQASTFTEAQTWTNPAIRVRHYNLRIETPIVDFLAGQYWSLFGWQAFYFPNTVEIMGLPAELFHRDIQFRVSKTIKTAPINIEIAAALVRSPQRDSGLPEGEGGVRLIVNKWTGMQTVNSTGTSIAPLSVGVSSTVRTYKLTQFAAAPKTAVSITAWGVAADGFIPILPATPDKKGNALSLTGEYVYGHGVADQYTGMTGGVANAELPNPTMATPAPAYTANIDPGLVVYSADGRAHLIQWQTFNIGLQYYLPGLNGRVWVAGAFSRSNSDNSRLYGAAAKVRDTELWSDANLFWDITPAIRVGAEYAWFQDHYVDGIEATNHRFQFSAFYLF
jgi:hypothetical protein